MSSMNYSEYTEYARHELYVSSMNYINHTAFYGFTRRVARVLGPDPKTQDPAPPRQAQDPKDPAYPGGSPKPKTRSP